MNCCEQHHIHKGTLPSHPIENTEELWKFLEQRKLVQKLSYYLRTSPLRQRTLSASVPSWTLAKLLMREFQRGCCVLNKISQAKTSARSRPQCSPEKLQCANGPRRTLITLRAFGRLAGAAPLAEEPVFLACKSPLPSESGPML